MRDFKHSFILQLMHIRFHLLFPNTVKHTIVPVQRTIVDIQGNKTFKLYSVDLVYNEDITNALPQKSEIT